MSSPYQDLPEHCRRIDRRQLRYRFDLERDVPWTRLSEPGRHVGAALAAELGVAVPALERTPGALAVFDWAFALASCEEFVALEEVILRFVEAERDVLGPVRSAVWLCEEEEKHIAMFRRYEAHLRAARPELAPHFDRAFAASKSLVGHLDDRSAYPDAASYHYVFWLNTLFFEEYTIYLHEQLAHDAAGIQPAWLGVHAAHRKEEEQHLITDLQHLEALSIGEDARYEWSKAFFMRLASEYGRFFGLEAARGVVLAACPGADAGAEAGFAGSAFESRLLFDPRFRRTRQVAPYLTRLAAARQGARPAKRPPVGRAPAQRITTPPLPSRPEGSAPGTSAPRASMAERIGTAARGIVSRLQAGAAQPTTRRYKLRELEGAKAPPATERAAPVVERAAQVGEPDAATLLAVRQAWAHVLELPLERVGRDDVFFALGGDSRRAVEVHGALERRYETVLDHRILLECSTPAEFARFLDGLALRLPAPATVVEAPHIAEAPRVTSAHAVDVSHAAMPPVAIVGLAARLPGARDLDELWHLLRDGRDAFREVPAARWDAARWGTRDPRERSKTLCTRGAFLDDVSGFDPEAFDLPDAVAREMDPQQRLFLELCADVLAAAGGEKRVGVFASAGWNDYLLGYARDPALISGLSALGNLDNMVAARCAQALGLKGPALTTNAACASSLVAILLACRSLAAGECELAVAGGVELNLTVFPFLLFSQAGVLSPTGRCQPFSRAAAGFVPGEGGAAVLLRPLSRALEAGDHILGILRGGAMNNDGGALTGMAPSPDGQLDVLEKAYRAAGIDRATVSYVETHGTATPIGDTVEVRALSRFFDAAQPSGERLAIGSVKSNLGHLFTAAGVTSLAKVLLALEHRELPPIAGCDEPDPRVGFAQTKVEPVVALRPWAARGGVRRAGVSAFGVGGTNCHLVVEEAPARTTVGPSPRDAELVALSAPSATTLPAVGAALGEAFALRAATPLADLAASACDRAGRFRVRRAVVVRSHEDARSQLGAVTATAAPPRGSERVVLVFPGPGSQVPGMGRHLYEDAPVFRAALDRCDALLAPLLGRSLVSLVLDDAADPPQMDAIELSQPVVFAFGWALAEWIESLGIVPAAVVGHSAGEYVAACRAGALPLERALALVTHRGRAMADTPRGRMAAVFAPEATVARLLAAHPTVGFAALNEPDQVVVSGAEAAVDALLGEAERAGIASRPLRISCAAHSPLMRPAAEVFARHLGGLDAEGLRLPLYSTRTGARLERIDAAHLVAHLTDPVRFASAVRAAAADGASTFLELGATGSLSHCIRQVLGADVCAVPLVRRTVPGWTSTLEAVGTLFERGVPVRLRALELPAPRPRVRLPDHPYARRTFWIGEASAERGPELSPVAYAAPPPRAEPVQPAAREVRFVLADEPAIRDHVARGRPIAPAALLLDRALAFVREEAPEAAGLAGVLIGRPLGGEVPRQVRVAEQADAAGSLLTVSSRQDGSAGPFEENLRARAIREAPRPPARPLADLRKACPEARDVGALYDALARSGLDYGPSMRTLRAVWRSDGRVLARLEGAPASALDPALVDGAMQSIAVLFEALGEPDATFLGFAMQRVLVHAPLSASMWVDVRARTALAPGAESFRCDVTLLAEDGAVLVEFEDVALKRLRRAAEVAPRAWPVRWEPTPVPPPRRSLPRTALLLGQGGTLERALRRGLEDRGVFVLAEAWRRDRAGFEALRARLGPVAAVVAVDPDPGAMLAFAQGFAPAGALEVFAAGSDAAVPGFARVLGQETGWLVRAALLPEVRDARVAAALVAEICAEPAVFLVELGEGRRVPVMGPGVTLPYSRVARGPGFHWITGGTGGLGQAVGALLAAPLLLTGRRPEPPPGLLERLRAAGADPLYVSAGMTDEAALRAAVATARARFGPLRGVVHAAGVLDDGLVSARDPARQGGVLAPKVAGTAALLRAIEGETPDFVVLCASLAGVFGGAGQADYAAANASLDGVARAIAGQRARPSRVVAVDLGPIRDAGMVADARYQQRFAEQGLVPMAPRVAAEALLAATALGEPQLVVCSVSADREAALRAPWNLPVVPASPEVAPVASSAGAASLVSLLQQEIARALRRDAASIDPESSFQALGVDSLLAVELVRKLESAVGRPLPPTLLFERRCISDVAAHLGGAAVAQSAQQATPAPLPPPPADERVTLPPPREVAEGGHAAVLATPGALRLVRLASEPPAPGEVEIAVEAAGVNFIDVLATAGMHPRIASAAFVPGHEVAGTISRVGAGVALAPGMRVMALVRAGGYAERVVTPAESVTPLPDGVSAEDAAAVLLVGLTAIACLEEHAHLRAGETVLVQAAAGATGTACVQLAKHLGARVIGTAGGPEKLAHLARLGVDHPVDYRTTDFADAVRALTCGRGVDVIVDSLSGDAIGKGLGVLAPGGRFVEIGAAGVVPVPPVDPRVLFARDQAFIGCNVGRLDESPARLARLAARLLEHLASGALRPAIGGRYSLSDAADAHALLRARGNLGKLVLRP